MNFMNALNSIHSDHLKPVYLILGNQEYLIRQLNKQFINLIPSEERTMNYASYDIDDDSLADAMGDAMSAPFFGKRRVVIINHPLFLTGQRSNGKHKVESNEIETLINYLKKPMPTTVLVIIAPYNKIDGRKKVTKVLKRVAETIDLTDLYESQVRQYVKKFLNDRKFTLTNDAMDQLITKTGNQLSLIMNELPKLMLYCQNSHHIDQTAVDQLISNSLTQNAFDLVDLVLKRQSTNAIELYHNLLMAVQPSKLNSIALRINAVLVSQFRLLMQVLILSKQGYSQGSLSTTLKVHPYRVKLAMRTVHNFNLNRLQLAYLSLIELENKLKSGNQSPELLFEMFMIKFVKNQ